MNRAGLLLVALMGAVLVFAACRPAMPTPPPPVSYTLTVAVSPLDSGGTVAKDPPPGPGGRYSSGTVVKLTASPAALSGCKDTPYWAFSGWSGEVQGLAPVVKIAMDSDKSVTAIFKESSSQECSICEGPTLEISVNGDFLQFEQDKLQVAPDTEVALCLKNVSVINQHNWVLVQDGTKDDIAARGLEAGPDNDWVQPGDPDVVANTGVVKPGEGGEVSFTPPPAGTYQFVCTFPGHNFTMFGDFVVTP